MQKVRVSIIAGILVLLAGVWYVASLHSGSSVSKNGGEIILGFMGPLTGDAAQWGEAAKRGAELAASQINKDGGIAGRRLHIQFEDTRCEAPAAASAIRKLISVNKVVAVVGDICSSATLAAAPIANEAQTVLISPASTSPKVTDAGDFVFRTIDSDAYRGKVFADYLIDQNIRVASLLYINNDGGIGGKDSFTQEFLKQGGSIISAEGYDSNHEDFRTQLTKIKSLSAVQAVLVVSYPKDTALIMKQAKELGLTKPLYFQTEAVEDPTTLRAAGESAESVVYILPDVSAGPAYSDFVAAYQAQVHEQPQTFAAESYDAVELIAKALKQNSHTQAAGGIRQYLYTVKDYQGASGIITFDEFGDVAKPMAIKRIEQGRPVVITKK